MSMKAYPSFVVEAAKPPQMKRTLPSPHFTPQSPPDPTSKSTDRVLSSSSVFNSRSSPSLAAPQPTSPKGLKIMTTVPSTSLTRRVVRPLPAIPSPSSTPHSPSTPRSPRPLPTPPCTSPLSTTSLTSGDNTTSLTSIDVLGAVLPVAEGTPKAPGFKAYVESAVLSIQPSSNPAPVRHRKNTSSSLPRPHLGRQRRRSNDKAASTVGPLETLSDIKAQVESHEHFDRQTAIIVGKILDLSSPMDEEREWDEEGTDEVVQVHYSQMPEKMAIPLKARFSRHWLREKRGRRWEESDYQSIISTLRLL